MKLKLAERMENIKASEIRELLKLTEDPSIISFAGGLPSPELFPIEEISKIASETVLTEGKAALQYSTTEGYHLLREKIAKERIKGGFLKPEASKILITNGSQQALDFTGKLFISPGDIIFCESPTYLGAINAFNAYNPRFIELPMDDEGIIIEEFIAAIKKYPNAKFLYTIPDYQNPSGITLSIERRKEIARLSEFYELPIIEDSPYSELTFEGDMLPSIKSFDEGGYVIQLGSFSKTFCPGFRIGWIFAEDDILQKYILIKQGADLQSGTLDQRIIANYLKDYSLEKHILKLRETYRIRRDVMLDTMDTYFPKTVKYTHSKGGLFTWVELPSHIDTKVLLEEALQYKVAFVPGSSFFPTEKKNNFMRLNYSSMSEEKIRDGIIRLSQIISKYCEAAHTQEKKLIKV
ncbi:PLP-dependent aminotransferase family protein [Alloiococcus sp. CFN-8]|uniref:aminotransferase-like domain-containing protein n=1 Tax=Alloiococcus sp. CFN-8 TaxID=3416081 RepID=UPI003CF11793